MLIEPIGCSRLFMSLCCKSYGRRAVNPSAVVALVRVFAGIALGLEEHGIARIEQEMFQHVLKGSRAVYV